MAYSWQDSVKWFGKKYHQGFSSNINEKSIHQNCSLGNNESSTLEERMKSVLSDSGMTGVHQINMSSIILSLIKLLGYCYGYCADEGVYTYMCI